MTAEEICAYSHRYKNVLEKSGVKLSASARRGINGLIDYLIALETIRELQEHPSAGTPLSSELIADEVLIGEDGTQ